MSLKIELFEFKLVNDACLIGFRYLNVPVYHFVINQHQTSSNFDLSRCNNSRKSLP